MGTNGKILVFVDLPGGELDETGRGMLSYGARLAGILDSSWGAAVAVTPDSSQLATFGSYGTPAITFISGSDTLLDPRRCSENTWQRWLGMKRLRLSSCPTMISGQPWLR